MSIFITGDTHGHIDTQKRFDQYGLAMKSTKHEFSKENDYMIIAGDFGLIFSTNPEDEQEKYWTHYLHNKPWITLFIDGNHENFERLNALPEVNMFGGKVGVYTDSIFHLKRGYIYTIQGKTFFVMGGGTSIDKQWRKDRISWWTEELPNYGEYRRAIDTLFNAHYNVDYVVTHTAPDDIRQILQVNYALLKNKDDLSQFLFDLVKTNGLNFKKWYFGHYHIDDTIKNYEALYERILRIE
jgi:hypothetical protein